MCSFLAMCSRTAPNLTNNAIQPEYSDQARFPGFLITFIGGVAIQDSSEGPAANRVKTAVNANVDLKLALFTEEMVERKLGTPTDRNLIGLCSVGFWLENYQQQAN